MLLLPFRRVFFFPVNHSTQDVVDIFSRQSFLGEQFSVDDILPTVALPL